MNIFTGAAYEYIKRGWTPIALTLDAEGRPKKPISHGWQRLTPWDPMTRRQGWREALGVGLLCGPNSSNLEVIDIDDEELAAAVFSKLARGHRGARFVWTGRNRGHLYLRVQEPNPHPGPWRGVWNGREVKGELRGRGMQVAAPPTPGYILAADNPPQAVETVQKAWDGICLAMGIIQAKNEGGGNYPPAWQDTVFNGTRNDSLFVEACKLAAVRMPIERALELLRLNTELHYEDGHKMTDREFVASVRSAYQKAYPKVERPAESGRYRREIK